MAIKLKLKPDWYSSEKYDEKQLMDRLKISFETLMLTFSLILINFFILYYYSPWAADTTEMAILYSIPATYFMIRAVTKEAFFVKNEKNRGFLLVLFALTGITMMLVSVITIVANDMPLIENGLISAELSPFFIGLPLLSASIAYLIKKIIQKNVENEE
jgi:hypothetical protein